MSFSINKSTMNKSISILIPVFNEQDSLEELLAQINQTLDKKLSEYKSEIIFINDGSTDDSLNVLKKLSKKDKKIKIASFRKNLGKAVALNYGFQKSTGDLIVTLDADLQDIPSNIPVLISKVSEGYDLVVGWRKERVNPKNKTLPSLIFNFIINKSSQIPLHDFNTGLKVMKKQVAKELSLYGELHRFIPVLAYERGFKVAEVPVTHNTRKFGKTKYGLSRMVRGFFDFLTVMFLGNFSQRPLHFFGVIGLVSIFLGVIFGSYLSILHFQGESIGRRPLLNLSLLLVLGGLQILSIGFIGELLINSKHNKNLPVDYET